MKEKTRNFWKAVGLFCLNPVLPILVSGLIRAIAVYIFVTPNHFAPGGTNGAAVLLEYAFLGKELGIWGSSGFFLLVINIPLSVIAFFFLGKKEAVISMLSIAVSSALLMLLNAVAFLPEYGGVNATEPVMHGFLGAVAGGIFLGIALAIMLKSCGTSGGTTIIASIINKKYKNLSVSMLTSVFDAIVVLASFFVYNQGAAFTVKLDPVVLALISLYATSKMSDMILQGFKVAYKFEIITTCPDEIAQEIMTKLHHGVTRLSAEGMYSHEGKSMLVCIIRKRQIAEVQKIIKKYPDTFAYFSPTAEVLGKFAK